MPGILHASFYGFLDTQFVIIYTTETSPRSKAQGFKWFTYFTHNNVYLCQTK